ncbi:MAG: hypothetical protein JSR17_08760 [Proteobacteria bacterium]|nr:hypothetical protein [Pseudomonadota bacterium]
MPNKSEKTQQPKAQVPKKKEPRMGYAIHLMKAEGQPSEEVLKKYFKKKTPLLVQFPDKDGKLQVMQFGRNGNGEYKLSDDISKADWVNKLKFPEAGSKNITSYKPSKPKKGESHKEYKEFYHGIANTTHHERSFFQKHKKAIIASAVIAGVVIVGAIVTAATLGTAAPAVATLGTLIVAPVVATTASTTAITAASATATATAITTASAALVGAAAVGLTAFISIKKALMERSLEKERERVAKKLDRTQNTDSKKAKADDTTRQVSSRETVTVSVSVEDKAQLHTPHHTWHKSKSPKLTDRNLKDDPGATNQDKPKKSSSPQ